MDTLIIRGWDNEKKIMLPPVDLTGPRSTYKWLGRKDVILMRSTGLKDKNGKDIFYHDIVEFSFHDVQAKDDVAGHYDGTACIVCAMNNGVAILYDWDENLPGLVACSQGGSIEDIWDDEELWTFEVIGNIWENSDLLKP